MTPRCVVCGAKLKGAFYMGLPGWACDKHELPLVGGLGPTVAFLFGMRGYITIYHLGDYWGTLWAWLSGKLEP